MTKVLFIVNPNALKGKITKYIPQMLKNLKEKNFEVNLQYTKKEYSADKIIENNKNKFDLVICCSGDGTVNEIINAMMQFNTKTPIGLIPLGTMNDFAHGIEVSFNKLDLSRNISKYVIKKSDTGKFNDQYFNYVAAFGTFSNVGYETPNLWKRKIGKIAYFLKAFIELFRINKYEIEAKIDKEIVRGTYIYMSISNSKTIARIPWFSKKIVNFDDGKFEILLIKSPKYFIQLIPIFFSLIFHKYKNKHIIFKQASQIEIEFHEEVPWTLDGEFGGKVKKAQIKNIEKNIEYLVPNKEK